MQRSLISALILGCCTSLAQAEIAPAPDTTQQSAEASVPSADYATILDKAKAAPELQRRVQQMAQMAQAQQDPNMAAMMLNDVIGGFQSGREIGLSAPLPYNLLGKVQAAQERAQYFSQLLVSDLDNDGQITEQELRDTLTVSGQAGGGAEAFFSSDINGDKILSADELRTAVNAMIAKRGGRDRSGLPRLFDFDDDGYLTQEEFDRAMKALGYSMP